MDINSIGGDTFDALYKGFTSYTAYKSDFVGESDHDPACMFRERVESVRTDSRAVDILYEVLPSELDKIIDATPSSSKTQVDEYSVHACSSIRL